jgi:NADH-quinone oxidoreductase subunit M
MELSLIGALYASIKALAQVRLGPLIAWGGAAFFSLVWWHAAESRSVTPPAMLYAGSTALIVAGLFLGQRFLAGRYGVPGLERIAGLARPMPRFAFLLSLLVMGAVGLPPFGLFSGLMTMLLSPVPESSVSAPFISVCSLGVVAAVWFAASWYLFRMMQGILFGPHRTDLLHEDLRPGEVVSFAMVIAVLLILGLSPHWLPGEIGIFGEPATQLAHTRYIYPD